MGKKRNRWTRCQYCQSEHSSDKIAQHIKTHTHIKLRDAKGRFLQCVPRPGFVPLLVQIIYVPRVANVPRLDNVPLVDVPLVANVPLVDVPRLVENNESDFSIDYSNSRKKEKKRKRKALNKITRSIKKMKKVNRSDSSFDNSGNEDGMDENIIR